MTLSQCCYAKKILEKGGLVGCNPCQVLMQSKLKLMKDSNSSALEATEYRSLVGSLRYLIHTSPEVAYAVGYVSRYMEDPHEEHLTAVKHIHDGIEVPTVEGKLMLTKEEWCERAKKKEIGKGSRGGSNGDHSGHDRGRGNRRRGRGRSGHGENPGASGGCRNSGSCHRCGKPDHWAHDCCSK
jgi:hypothetical protein